MFIGREKELEELNRLYQTNQFQMPVIYGRRRVGKSTLIREFVKDKKAVLFTAIESSEEKNLELFSRSIYSCLMPKVKGMGAFTNFAAAFEVLAEQAAEERLVVVIDEYPYLATAGKSIASILQNYIDHYFQKGKLFLILCGSSMSFMENEVLGYQSPLYGRRTAQLKIQPFDYLSSAGFVPNYSMEDKALVYGVTGGIPKYLELFDGSRSVEENIVRLFFEDSGYLYEEPSNLLKQELRDASTYNAVLSALAGGATKVSELAGKMHMDTAAVTYSLNVLISLGIVKKEAAVTEENNKKKTYYMIADHMFRFWYRFVQDGTEMISLRQGSIYYREIVAPQITDYMGKIFEDMCREYFMKLNSKGETKYPLIKIGRWWGNNPKLRREEEIDILGVNTMRKMALIGECKYRNEGIYMDTVRNLLEKGKLIHGFSEVRYTLCSKTGFSDEVKAVAEKEKIKLLTLDDLYSEEA